MKVKRLLLFLSSGKETAIKYIILLLTSAALVATCSSVAEAQVTRDKSRNPGSKVVPERKIKNETQPVGLPFISDVRVTPSASNVIISFKSSERTPPLIEIGKSPPARDRSSIMAFPYGSAFSRFVQPQDGRYTLNINLANEQLEAGTTYYYIINVFNDNQNDPKRKREQQVGQFTTLSQTVKVVWERVVIVNDSDDGGAGEISLWFWINHGQPGAKSLILDKLGNNSASSGQSFQIEHHYSEYVIENASNDLSLSVSGVEDDTSVLGGVARGTAISEPVSGPSKDANFEWNIARGTIDLTRFQSEVGETRSEPFKLVSMPNGGVLGNLSFEVYGHFEITRRDQ